MDTKIIKEIVSGLPVTGDTLILIQNGFAVYKSGGKIQVDNSTRLKVGDTVTGVYHGHDTENGQTKIYVNVEHLVGESDPDDIYYNEYLRIKRKYVLTELLSNGNN